MNLNRLLRNREILVLLILLFLTLVIGIINPAFLQSATLLSIVDTSLILILVSIGEMFVILTKGIDVSVGAIMGISAVILGTSLNAGVPLPLAIVLALLTGIAAGAINGVGVTIFKVPPIIMTLGALGVYRGLMLIITGGSWIETIPQSIKSMAGWEFLGVSAFAWTTAVIAIAVALLLRRVKQARFFYAVGDNENGAFLLGVPVRKTILAAYAISGLFAGIASVIFVAQIGFVPMQTGNGLELRAIAASVLGGVNLAGGVGTPFSGVVGGLFLTVIDSVLIFLKVPAFWNNAIAGAILLIVVLVDYRIRLSLDTKQRQARARVRAQAGTAVSTSRLAMEEPQ
jgi:AI-2 transport system permease protein